MDFLSIILSAIGWEKDRAGKASDRRIEVYRLNAEVAVECMRAANILATATPGIMRRLHAAFPDQPELCKSWGEGLTKMQSEATQLQAMAEGYKVTIEKASSRIDWDNALMKMHEWRATAAGICPEADTIINRISNLLGQAEEAQGAPRPVTSQRERDRGWDAPPL